MKLSALYHLTTLIALSKQISAYGITGLSGGVNYDTGERPVRRDLRDLQSSGAAFDLYVQALAQFQADDQSDLVSYYEVAGRHQPEISKLFMLKCTMQESTATPIDPGMA